MPPSDGRDFGDLVATQQYPFNVAAGANAQVSPANPHRAYVLVQNQTVNEIVVQFDRPTGNVNDYLIAGMDEKEWSIKVPTGSINIGCAIAGGSSGVVIEGRRK